MRYGKLYNDRSLPWYLVQPFSELSYTDVRWTNHLTVNQGHNNAHMHLRFIIVLWASQIIEN